MPVTRRPALADVAAVLSAGPTVRRWFYLWLAINHTLLMAAREAQGREASPSVGVIDRKPPKAAGIAVVP